MTKKEPADISFIMVEGPIKNGEGADWPEQWNIDAYVGSNNIDPAFMGCGPHLDSALRAITRLTGRDLEYLKSKIYKG